MLRNRRSQSSLCCLDLLDQLRHDLEQIAHDAVVGNTEDGCALILVDSDDALGVLHTSGVLDSAGDAQSNIDLGVHGLAGLTNLMVSRQPAGVDGGTGAANNAAQDLSQLLSQLDAALNILGNAAAHRHDEVSADQVHQLLSGLHHLGDVGVDVLSSQSEAGLHDLNSVGLGLVKGVLLHNAGTDGSHAGTETGADDGSHQVTAESGTGHLQVAVLHIPLLAVHTYRNTSSLTRRRCIRLSPIVQYSPLLPPVGVWAVSQSQCGRSPSQVGYGSSPWWAVTSPTS